MPIFYASVILVFILAYLTIALEQYSRINKTASALLAGGLCWMLFFIAPQTSHAKDIALLGHHLSDTSQIILFLLGAMTIVELIDSHHGFQIIVENIRTRSKVRMVWIVGLTTFFVSSILDNLTATIVMVSLLRRMIPERTERWMFGAVVVLAANSGGAWTPIGDVTTTMLWIHGNLTTISLIKSLFLPSLISLLVVLIYMTIRFWGDELPSSFEGKRRIPEPGARLAFIAGVLSLVSVPIVKGLTGVPPFMGMLLAVGFMWLITDLWHRGHHDRDHLKIPHALTRIDTSSILFFLGILLAVSALEATGALADLAGGLSRAVPNSDMIAVVLGLVSAIIDNVPLVAAAMSMYDLSTFPTDSSFWNMIAYCAGTGGSIVIIGSAAGVAFMGLEKVDFLWYLRKIAPIALLSYLIGAGSYLLLRTL